MRVELGRNRIGKFSLLMRRWFVGLALVPCVVSVANFWGLFGTRSKGFIAVSFVGLFLVMRYLGPTVQQIREYRRGLRDRPDFGEGP